VLGWYMLQRADTPHCSRFLIVKGLTQHCIASCLTVTARMSCGVVRSCGVSAPASYSGAIAHYIVMWCMC